MIFTPPKESPPIQAETEPCYASTPPTQHLICQPPTHHPPDMLAPSSVMSNSSALMRTTRVLYLLVAPLPPLMPVMPLPMLALRWAPGGAADMPLSRVQVLGVREDTGLERLERVSVGEG